MLLVVLLFFFDCNSHAKVTWSNSTSAYVPLSWWKGEFTWPHNHHNLALDLSSIGMAGYYCFDFTFYSTFSSLSFFFLLLF
jgi:hypothetical protein